MDTDVIPFMLKDGNRLKMHLHMLGAMYALNPFSNMPGLPALLFHKYVQSWHRICSFRDAGDVNGTHVISVLSQIHCARRRCE